MVKQILAAHGIDSTHEDAVDDALRNGECYAALYDHYLPEMPYGTAKARTGDPMQWMADRLGRELVAEDCGVG